MNGVTGRMGANQHLIRSICAIRNEGGLRLNHNDNAVAMPQPILVGRNKEKLRELAQRAGGVPWTTDLDNALANPEYSIYFDAQVTDRRVAAVKKAIAAGK